MSDLETKDPGENVTFGDLQKAHKELEKEWKSQFSELRSKIDKYADEHGDIPSDIKEQMDRLNDRIDELEAIKRRTLDQYEAQKDEEPTAEEKAYQNYIRDGRHTKREHLENLKEAKDLATDSNVDGGYLVPRNTRDEIIRKRRAISPVRQYATVLSISSGNSLRVPKEDDSDFGAGWTGERESRGETATSGFEMLDIPTHEMYAKPLVTQQMLDDSEFDVEGWLESKVSEKFSRKEASAFVDGDGSNKPEGILDDVPSDKKVASGESTGIIYGSSNTDKGLLGLVYDIEIDDYVRNATMMMNRKTVGRIRGITDDQNMPIWSPGISETDPPSILGYEYFTATDMPKPDTDGNVSIVFGDLSIAYYIVDRADIRFLRDPYSSKPQIEFYYTTRVGGQVVQEEALRYLVTGTSV